MAGKRHIQEIPLQLEKELAEILPKVFGSDLEVKVIGAALIGNRYVGEMEVFIVANPTPDREKMLDEMTIRIMDAIQKRGSFPGRHVSVTVLLASISHRERFM